MNIFPLFALLTGLLSSQVQLSELCLLSRKYNYRPQAAQSVTLIASILVLLIAVYDMMWSGLDVVLLFEVVLCALAFIVSEWLLALWSPKLLAQTIVWRLIIVIAMAFVINLWGQPSLLPFVLIGLFFRNSPFGVVHGKPFWLAYWFVVLVYSSLNGVTFHHQWKKSAEKSAIG